MVISALATACAAETVELPPPAPAYWQSSTATAPSPTSPRFAALGPLLDDEALFRDRSVPLTGLQIALWHGFGFPKMVPSIRFTRSLST
jgi:hypothetical protein